jgi:hypothetical protein
MPLPVLPTYIELCAAMQSRKQIVLKGKLCTINSIQAESGDGKSWNVAVAHDQGQETVFVRTH